MYQYLVLLCLALPCLIPVQIGQDHHLLKFHAGILDRNSRRVYPLGSRAAKQLLSPRSALTYSVSDIGSLSTLIYDKVESGYEASTCFLCQLQAASKRDVVAQPKETQPATCQGTHGVSHLWAAAPSRLSTELSRRGLTIPRQRLLKTADVVYATPTRDYTTILLGASSDKADHVRSNCHIFQESGFLSHYSVLAPVMPPN